MQYFDFLNLHGYKRLHEYHHRCEDKRYSKLCRYFTNHYQCLIPKSGEMAKSAIPQDWYKYNRSDVTQAEKKKAVKAGFEKWLEWEKTVRQTLTECTIDLRTGGECAAAYEIEKHLCDIDEEIKRAERMLLTLKSVDFSMEYIEEIQSGLHEKYKSKK